MPVYEFENEAGHRVERVFSIRSRPNHVTIDGVRFDRVPSLPGVAASPDRSFISQQLPKGAKGADGYTKSGKPMIWRDATVNEIEARHGVKWSREAFQEVGGNEG